MNNEFYLRAKRGDLCFGPDDINLYAYQKQGRDIFIGQKLELKLTKDTLQKPEPFLTIHNHTAQKFMDDLWDCGLRPSEGTGSAGSLAATQRHLQDMKTVAFHALKIQEK